MDFMKKCKSQFCRYKLAPYFGWQSDANFELWEKAGADWLLRGSFRTKEEAMLKIDLLGLREDEVQIETRPMSGFLSVLSIKV